MYATRSVTWVFEITGPQTGMKGRFGFFDSPRPCVMIRVSVATVSACRLAESRHVGRDAAAAERAVARGAGELDEIVGSRGDMRIDLPRSARRCCRRRLGAVARPGTDTHRERKNRQTAPSTTARRIVDDSSLAPSRRTVGTPLVQFRLPVCRSSLRA